MVYDLKKYLYWSGGAHLFALLTLLVSPYLPFTSYRPRDEKITWVTLPKGVGDDLSSIKKALDLPKTTIEQQKQKIEPVKPAKKPEMTYQKKEPLKGSKPREKTPEELRMEEALARAKQQVAARKAAVPEAAQIPDGKGGGVPEGTATGNVVPPDDPERILYQLKIRQQVRDEWIPPLNLQNANLGLLCKVVVRINERGELLTTEWEQKSGNEVFDLSALRAIQKAAPLDPPPERLKWEAIHEGFLFEFKPEDKQP